MSGDVLILDPFALEVVWGGHTLQRDFGKDAAPDCRLGETWEVSCVPGRETRVRATGKSLRAHFEETPEQFAPRGAAFPLLVKLISTSALLSLQVHPDDAAAQRLEGEPNGKHEAWWVLAAEPDAHLFLGLAEGRGRDDLAAAVATGRSKAVAGVLRRVEVAPGDVFDVPPGTVHALGPGLTLIEVQQPSDLTYRLFDWERVGLDGKPRPVHVEKALPIVDPASRPARAPAGPAVRGGIGECLLDRAAFRFERWRIDGQASVPTDGFMALVCAGGSGTVQVPGHARHALSRGQSCVIPRGVSMVELSGRDLLLAAASPSPTAD